MLLSKRKIKVEYRNVRSEFSNINMKLKTLLEIYHRQAFAMNVFESCCSEIRKIELEIIKYRRVTIF